MAIIHFNNDKTNKYFDIRTNSLNKILEKKKECFPYVIYVS